jgi:hypothetical protein
MANCSVQTGVLFWKKPCIHPALGNCAKCRKFVCQIHSEEQRDGTRLCGACRPVEERDDDYDTASASGSGIALGGLLGAAAGSSSVSERERTVCDSESGDSGSSDSCSGDSGGSSSD